MEEMTEAEENIGKADQSQESRAEPSSKWLAEIEAAKERVKPWHRSAWDVIRVYRNEGSDPNITSKRKRFNLFWSNVEVLKSSLFVQLGKPDVRRQFPKPGSENKAARTTALVLERALIASNNCHDDEVEIQDAIFDDLLAGRGQCWLELEVEEYENGVMRREAKTAYVPWDEYLQGVGRRFQDVSWVARLLKFTREDLQVFGDHAKLIPLGHEVKDSGEKKNSDSDMFKRAAVWEIWDKAKKQRIYVAEGYQYILKRDEDPYELEGFFPCPRPLQGVRTTDTQIPVPEYCQWSDQAKELDRVTDRISVLTEALKYNGFFDAAAEDVDALNDIGRLEDNEFRPYKGAAALQNGLANALLVRDLAPIVTTLGVLVQYRQQLVQAIYEITGISDIIRGQSDSRETLGAQQLKAKFGSQRMQMRQRDVQRFVADIYRSKAELIAEHYDREQLEEMTGVPLPLMEDVSRAQATLAQIKQQQAAAQAGGQQMQPQLSSDQMADLEMIAKASPWESIQAILQSDDRRNYKIDIETDATSFEDTEVEKAQRLEFLKTISELLAQAIPSAQANPALGPLMKELVTFGTKAFKVGRTLEDTLEETFDQLQSAQKQADPSVDIARQQFEMKMKEFELELQKTQMEMQAMQAKYGMEANAMQVEAQNKQQLAAIDLQSKQADLVIKLKQNELKAQELEMAGQKAVIDRASAVNSAIGNGAF